jgi:ABC-type nitrate/sulfonate/bicarbonate transport system substrate-binding protein
MLHQPRVFAVCLIAFLLHPLNSTGLCAGAEPSLEVVELDGPRDISRAGALVASKEGFFARQGISVRFSNAQEREDRSDDGSTVIVHLQNARDFLIARAAGAPLVAIAGNYVDSSVTFFFRRDRNIRSAQDLAGKSIGYDPNSDTGLIFEWFLANNPVARSTITERPTNAGLQGLMDNSVDVVLGHSGLDNLELGKAGIDYGTLDPRAYGVHALGTVYVTSESNVRQKPETLVRFLRALIAGWDHAYNDPDQAVLLLASPSDSEAQRNALKRALQQQREYQRPGGVRIGEALRSRWIDLYTFMSQRRLIRAPIDLSKATDTKLLTEAYRVRLGPTNMAD